MKRNGINIKRAEDAAEWSHRCKPHNQKRNVDFDTSTRNQKSAVSGCLPAAPSPAARVSARALVCVTRRFTFLYLYTRRMVGKTSYDKIRANRRHLCSVFFFVLPLV